MSVEERKKLHASNLWKTKYLITPDASAWICWETFMLLLIAYESVTAPMQISIFRLMGDESKGHIIDVVDIIVTVAFFHFSDAGSIYRSVRESIAKIR